MLDLTPIDNEETSASGGNEVPGSKAELEGMFGTKGKGYVECLNSSFGSIEGFGEGGESECQEVSLELQVAGLQHQVSPVGIAKPAQPILDEVCGISQPRSRGRMPRRGKNGRCIF